MEDFGKKERHDREEVYSKAIRAGKRTYFFDVKTTRAEDKYLTITESKRRFNNEQGKFIYEKHKIFLYKEDFEKFMHGLTVCIDFIDTGIMPEPDPEPEEPKSSEDNFSDVNFEDLGGKSAEE
jgi:hypothetical protein